MSFHPNDLVRRARAAGVLIAAVLLVLLGAFFRTQVLDHELYALQSQQNRLREIPLAAPRGIIYDRHGKVIAENVVGYSVSLVAQKEDSLRAVMQRLSGTIEISPEMVAKAVRRFRANPTRPTVIIPDAPFDVVSVLEEHRIEFPGLIIQSAPKRYYPEGEAVASFVGYTAEINESELTSATYSGYKPGQQIGKQGLEKQYEKILRGREGSQFIEVDARGNEVSSQGRPALYPVGAKPLHTNIDLELQKYVVSLFGDSLQGGAVAMDPRTGAVFALHSAPSYDPNQFIGGIPADYYRQLREDPRKPLYNKALQGQYPPASTWKLATSIIGMELGLVDIDTHLPLGCSGGMQFGSRYFRCWEKRGHGNLDLRGAIAKSCDVFFYQLGLKIGMTRLIAGGVHLGFTRKAGIDLPEERRSIFPYGTDYYNKRFGPRGWTRAEALNLAIGQGPNSQTILNMARFFTALATDGHAAKPEIVRLQPQRTKIVNLRPEQLAQLREAMADVVSARGTAGSAAIQGVVLAGKTGTAQNAHDRERDHAWFVGYAPAEAPRIVVAVMLEFGEHGYSAARIASKIVSFFLKVQTQVGSTTEG